MITLTLETIGGASVTITGEHETEIIKRAEFWFSLPPACPICQAPLVFGYRNPQTFEYYAMVCVGPVRHTVNLGEKKNSHDLYFDKKKNWEKYNWQPSDGERSSGPPASNNQRPGPAPIESSPARQKMIGRIIELNTALKNKQFKPNIDIETLTAKTDEQLIAIGQSLAEKCKIANVEA